MIDENLAIKMRKHAHAREYKEAIDLIQEKDDIVNILALAYSYKGYDIISEIIQVGELLLNQAKSNYDAEFIAALAVAISENKTNIETYYMDEEMSFAHSVTNGDNPCIEIYEEFVNKLYILSIQKAKRQDDFDIISEYLEYEGYTLQEYKEKYLS